MVQANDMSITRRKLISAAPFLFLTPSPALSFWHGGGLPSGATGIWDFSKFQSTPRRAVPNDQSAIAVSQNLLAAPRNLFANTNLWAVSGATATDSGLTGPDGFSDGSTFVAAGNFSMSPSISVKSVISLSAGQQYTLAIWAKRNTGTDQQFILRFNTTGSSSPTKTATSAWQRFTFTATVTGGSETTTIQSFDGSTGANLQICGLELFAGAADLGVVPSSHLYFGMNQTDTTVPVTSGSGDFSASGSMGLIQFPSDQTPSTFTVLGIVKKSVTGGGAHQAMLSGVANFGNLTAYIENSGVQNVLFGGTGHQQDGGSQQTGLWDFFYEGGWHMITSRYDGTAGTVHVDDQGLMYGAASATPATWRDLYVGAVNGLSLNANYKFAVLVYYPRALTQAEITQAYAALKAMVLASSSISMTTLRSIVPEGDSNTQGNGVAGYPYLYGPNSNPKLVGVSWAVAGTGLTNVIARGVNLRAITPAAAGRKLLYTFMPGNQLTSYSGGTAQYTSDMFAEMDRNRAAGFTVGLITAPPRSAAADAGFNAARAVLNPLIRSSVGVHCDFVIDFAADPTIGPDAAALDPTYYDTGLHLTAVAESIAEGIYRTAVNAQ